MIKSVKIVSVCFICISCFYFIFHSFSEFNDRSVQNKIIDSVFNYDVREFASTYDVSEYLGYIDIPRFGVKRLIKNGTSLDILDSLFVGVYDKSGDIDSDDLVILAGHNVNNVFGYLHSTDIGDFVYINGVDFSRKFVVYDKIVVDEYNNDYFYNRKNELLLITCDKKGYRLLVFLKEVL